jgi:hypothetical protein
MRNLITVRLTKYYSGVLSRRIRQTGHVERMGQRSGDTGFWWGKLRERNHLEVPDLDGRIILMWIFRKWDVGIWSGLIWLRKGTVCGLLQVR